jgi:hypothetical protein
MGTYIFTYPSLAMRRVMSPSAADLEPTRDYPKQMVSSPDDHNNLFTFSVLVP